MIVAVTGVGALVDAGGIVIASVSSAATSVAGAAYTYDANGNLKTRGNETYDYDHENHLTRIMFDSFDPYPGNFPQNGCNDFNGDTVITVTGDVMLYSGQINKQVPPHGDGDPLLDINNDGFITVTGDVLWFSGKIGKICPRKFSYNGDGLRVTGELGRFWSDYTWDVAAGLPVVLQETYREKTKMPQETRYVKTYVHGLDLISVYTDDQEHGTTAQDYYLSDGLGSTVTLARDAGESAAWTYDAFGEVRTKTGTLSTSFLFTGEQFDAKARQTQGLYYLRARYYDPSIGRFLTGDPFGGFVISPQSLNRYPYSVNDPVNLVDPWGLCGFRSFADFGDCFRDAADTTRDAIVDAAQSAGQALSSVNWPERCCWRHIDRSRWSLDSGERVRSSCCHSRRTRPSTRERPADGGARTAHCRCHWMGWFHRAGHVRLRHRGCPHGRVFWLRCGCFARPPGRLPPASDNEGVKRLPSQEKDLNPENEERREAGIRARLAVGFWYAVLLTALAVPFGLATGMPVPAVAFLVLGTFGSAMLGLWIASKFLRRNRRL